MQFTTVFTIFAAATLAMGAAVPYAGEEPSMSKPEESNPEGGYTCGNNQKASCCDAGAESAPFSLADGILGGSCSLMLLGGSCNQGSVACCDTTQDGFINLALPCIPITL